MATLARFELVVVGLLACNTVYYVAAGRFSEALESVAWYVLLMLFLLETGNPRGLQSIAVRAALRTLRLVATLAITMSLMLYVREKEWLDAANLALWIAVVVLLECEVWRPAAITTHRKAYTLLATVLYAALGVLVLVWLTQGKWMNAWDAALWLAAFGLLEINILKRSQYTISFKNK